jgi:hypothetical protein
MGLAYFGSLASTNATISSTDHSLSVMPAAAKFKLRHYPRLSLPPRRAHGRPVSAAALMPY